MSRGSSVVLVSLLAAGCVSPRSGELAKGGGADGGTGAGADVAARDGAQSSSQDTGDRTDANHEDAAAPGLPDAAVSGSDAAWSVDSRPADVMPDLAPARTCRQTVAVGNQPAGVAFDRHDCSTPIRQVRFHWDGDKVRGVQWISGTTTVSYGDNGNDYGVALFEFNPGETLTTMELADTGYGYGSLFRMSLRTSLGRAFDGGPAGGTVRSPAVNGCVIVGFAGSVNADAFMNGFSVWLSSP